MIQKISRMLLAASVLALAACSNKKSPTGTTPTPASITLTTGAATLSVQQGATGTAELTVGRTNYPGDVLLTAEGLPSGITATFTPSTLGSGTATSSLALAATGSATPGASTVTVRARGNGVADVTTSIALTVAPTSTGTIALALTPDSSTILAGRSAVSTLAITRGGGFAGGVTLTLSGAPSGLTFSFSSANPVTANSVTLNLSAATSVVPGPYTLTVRGNAPGLTEATATYVLRVNPLPSNSISWRYCNPSRIPSWFAYQDGPTGTWQRVTPTGTDTFDFGVDQPTVGVATVYTDLGVTVTDVRYYGVGELQAAANAECTDNPAAGTKSLSGTVTGLASAMESANVAIGNVVSTIASQSSPEFTLSRVQSGPRDLIAARVNTGTSSAERLLLIRATNFADGGSTGPLNLGTSPSFAPASALLTVTAPNDGTLVGSTNFRTATGTSAVLQIGAMSSGVGITYQGFPESVLLSTDQQQVTVTQNVGATINRSISRFIRGPVPVTMSMPGDPGVPTITAVAGASYPRATASGALPSGFNRQVAVRFDPSAPSRRWIISSTSAARGGELTYSLTMPDFSQVPGWTAAWQLPAGAVEVNSSFSGQTGASTSGEPISGTTRFTISRKSSFTF